jgi:hypothetical protein
MKPGLDIALVNSGKVCWYCGNPTTYVDSATAYGVSYGMIYQCKPCDAYVGVHKGTDTALGSVANKMLRMQRNAAHRAFDPLWKDKHLSRNEAYAELSQHMGTPPEYTHIAMFNTGQCQQVIKWAQERLPQQPTTTDMGEIRQGTVTLILPHSKRATGSNIPGEDFLQYYRIQMSDQPGKDMYTSVLIKNPQPVEVGKEYRYNEQVMDGGKVKIIFDRSSLERNAPAEQPAGSPQLAPPRTAPPTPQSEPVKPVPPGTPPPVQASGRPDDDVRTARVTEVKYLKTVNFRDSAKFEFLITFDNGERAHAWTDHHVEPYTVGQLVKYTLKMPGNGKPYEDGCKRMEEVKEVPTATGGGTINKEVAITRMACVNSSIAYHNVAGDKPSLEQVLADAITIENHVTRTT